MQTLQRLVMIVLFCGSMVAAYADPFTYNNLLPDGKMAMASGPLGSEAADDFVLTNLTTLTSASFTGLLVPAAGGGLPSVTDVVVEIYRVFPNDSNTTRTPNVLTRVNSPSDVEFLDRDGAIAGQMTFSTSILASSFTAANSVAPNGINLKPNQTTGGNGAVVGQEVQFNVAFTSPITLPADHYFFVPVVTLSNGGTFYWLSAPKPIVSGTPFPAGFTDLQAWIRNDGLEPDWSRVGTDIVGGTTPPTFNAAFSLTGTTATATPEPSAILLSTLGLVAIALRKLRRA